MSYVDKKPGYPHEGYPQLPPQYTPHPMKPDQLPSVITHQPVHIVHVHKIASAPVGSNPTMIVCPSCNHNVMTRLECEASSLTHLIALGLCLLGCWPCVLVPYCTKSCQNVNHYCPNCKSFIGTYRG